MRKKKNNSNVAIQEQIMLMNLFQEMIGGDRLSPVEVGNKEISFEEEYKKYLDKGERIISLLKKKATTKTFITNTLFDKIGSKKVVDKDSFYVTLERVVFKLIKEMMDTSYDENNESWFQNFESSFFYCFFSKMYHIEVEEKDSYAHRLMGYHLTRKTIYNKYRVLRFTSKDNGFEYYAPIGAELKSNFHKQRRGFKRDKVYIALIDASRFLANDYLVSYFLKSRDMLLENEFLKSKWKKDMLHLLLARKKDGRVVLPQKCITEALATFMKDNGLCFYADENNDYPSVSENHIMTLSFLLFEKQVEGIGTHFWKMALSNVYYDWWQQYSQNRAEYNFSKKLYSDYATSYMTKKNYSDRYLKAMAKSRFNDFFGYVEIDADCELQKVEELELEFRALARELSLTKNEEVSLRFRKLGNHKAAGLYYPMLKCLCVDIRCPSSFAHEVGHMLDYESGELSAKYEFYALYEAYKEAVNEALKKCSDSEKVVYCGTGKYNLSYYFQKTEVFARCFEMYLLRFRGVNNSLLKPELNTLPYPNSDKVNNLIESYFENNLFLREENVYGISK